MKIGKQEKDLLIGLAGVVVAVLVWFLVASPTMDKTDAIRAENNKLRPKAEEYQAVYARIDEYQSGIIEFQNEYAEIISHYPADIQREDQLMFWANMDKAYPDQMRLGDIAMAENWEAITVERPNSEETAENVATEEAADAANGQYLLYGTPIAMEYAATYTGLKDLFRYINAQYERNQIVELNVAFDETEGYLTGDILVNLFLIQGGEREYTPVFIPAIPAGVDDVFHTVSTNVNATAEEVEQLEETENTED